MKNLYLNIICLLVMVFFVRCKKEYITQVTKKDYVLIDSITTSNSSTNYHHIKDSANFVLFINEYAQTLDVSFITTNLVAIPKVVINDSVMTDLHLYIQNEDKGGLSQSSKMGTISGVLTIKRAPNVSFKISANGKTVSGTLKVPSVINSLMGNGFLLNDSVTAQVFFPCNLTWQSDTADFYELYLSGNTSNTYLMAANNFMINDNNSYYYSLSSCTGYYPWSEAKPNFIGTYGRGYVSAYNASFEWGYISEYITKKSATITPLTKEQKQHDYFKKLKSLLLNP